MGWIQFRHIGKRFSRPSPARESKKQHYTLWSWIQIAMRKIRMIKILLFLTALIVVVGLSILTHSELGVFSFAQGSDSDLYIVRSSLWATAALSAALLLIIAFLIWYPRLRVAGLVMLAALIFVWTVNGRVMGVYSDGRIIAGWFCMRTEVVNFRELYEDPEVYVSHMTIMAHSKWNVEIRSREHKVKMFVGPILRKSLLKTWKEDGFKVIE
jgi:hypothetical protein